MSLSFSSSVPIVYGSRLVTRTASTVCPELRKVSLSWSINTSASMCERSNGVVQICDGHWIIPEWTNPATIKHVTSVTFSHLARVCHWISDSGRGKFYTIQAIIKHGMQHGCCEACKTNLIAVKRHTSHEDHRPRSKDQIL